MSVTIRQLENFAGRMIVLIFPMFFISTATDESLQLWLRVGTLRAIRQGELD